MQWVFRYDIEAVITLAGTRHWNWLYNKRWNVFVLKQINTYVTVEQHKCLCEPHRMFNTKVMYGAEFILRVILYQIWNVREYGSRNLSPVSLYVCNTVLARVNWRLSVTTRLSHARPLKGPHVQQNPLWIYRVIHKSLRDFRTRLRNNQDRHGRKEHINR